MQLEDYFDFVSPDEILVRGTRIGVEVILAEYFADSLPEEIVCQYPSLTLEQVHATITWYLHHRAEADQYYQRWAAHGEAAVQQQSSPLIDRLRQARTGASPS